MARHAHTQTLQTHTQTHTHTEPKGSTGSSSCKILDRFVHQSGLFISSSTSVLHKVCECITFKRKKYIRCISEFAKAIPPPHSSLVAEQSSRGSYNTVSPCSNFPLDLCFMVYETEPERTALRQLYKVTKLSWPYRTRKRAELINH